MAIYSVHEPPQRVADTLAHSERFVFVRDGFYWSAFIFGPLWMLRHRLWLVLIGSVAIVTAMVAGLRMVHTSTLGVVAAAVLLQMLVGMEASTLRRWTLARRGWSTLGIVAADDLEAAERRFFDAWVRGADLSRLPPDPRAGATQTASQAAQMARASGPDVIGLFPEPGTRS